MHHAIGWVRKVDWKSVYIMVTLLTVFGPGAALFFTLFLSLILKQVFNLTPETIQAIKITIFCALTVIIDGLFWSLGKDTKSQH